MGRTLRNKLIEVRRRRRRRATLEEVDPAVACAAAAPRHEQATRDALVSEKGPLPVHLINAAVSGREMRPWRRKRGRKGGIHRPFDPSSSPFLVSPLFGIFQAQMWRMSFLQPWSFLSLNPIPAACSIYGSQNIKFSYSTGISAGISNQTCLPFWSSVSW